METRLSTLNSGDTFKFKPNQAAKYVVYYGSHDSGLCETYETKGNTEWLVIKRNKTAIRVRPITGSVEYYFKYAGIYVDAKTMDRVHPLKGVNCTVIKTNQ